MSDRPIADDPREEQARRWSADCLGLVPECFVAASSDASFRRYFRLQARGKSWIVMDAPPEREDCRPFIQVAALMQAAGVHVPEVIARDLSRGFLLLSDLGRQTYLDVLNEANAEALFDDALAALLRWQRASRPGVLPVYDEALLRRELALFPDWYLRHHLGLELHGVDADDWRAVCDRLVASALAQPRLFVHRDFMPRNLMLSRPNPGVLDFQDAVLGPVSYDVISLFRDAFLSWPAERVERGLRRYWQLAAETGLPVPEFAEFRRAADWMGAQRHLKVLGIFARINYRDGKPRYLADTPRFVRYVIDVATAYPQLAPLRDLFRRLVLPRLHLNG